MGSYEESKEIAGEAALLLEDRGAEFEYFDGDGIMALGADGENYPISIVEYGATEFNFSTPSIRSNYEEKLPSESEVREALDVPRDVEIIKQEGIYQFKVVMEHSDSIVDVMSAHDAVKDEYWSKL